MAIHSDQRHSVARPMCCSAAVFVAVLLANREAPAAPPDKLDQWREQALELVNEDRKGEGREALTLGDALDEAAQFHANDMAKRNYYSHTSPEGNDVQDRFIDVGGSRWELVEENIARCSGCRPPITAETIRELEKGWMNSPHHRENILRQGISRFGFGIVLDDKDGLYAVQTFAGPGTPRGSEADEAPKVLTSDEISARAAQLLNQARKKEDVGTFEVSAALTEVAQSLMPDPASENLSLSTGGGLLEALPANQRTKWRSLSVVSAACGGCGTRPTLEDLRSFRRQWLDNPQYSQRLLDSKISAIGFALQTTGSGRKVAVLVLGQPR
ncbi:CAP domain-containing protein [Consotaella salsifontis]|uniref:Cysteine-rich secretory protein family protein n=1 Tax=Consotaella salsifontis TaxID=1365950 RepID=A0A1T4NH84_9HYPH|nr:CAP domain-containing protein [Consotaella salsifontis]SJZ78691.1 Cysteine-rich secretory protein family protein [Consotaella salsifontis]